MRLAADFPMPQPRFENRSGYLEFVVQKKWQTGRSMCFGLPCQSLRPLLHTHHHTSSRAGTTGHIVADIPNELSLTQLRETETKPVYICIRYSITADQSNYKRPVCVTRKALLIKVADRQMVNPK
jgi:hypothetical protein